MLREYALLETLQMRMGSELHGMPGVAGGQGLLENSISCPKYLDSSVDLCIHAGLLLLLHASFIHDACQHGGSDKGQATLGFEPFHLLRQQNVLQRHAAHALLGKPLRSLTVAEGSSDWTC